jgi:peptidyl-prolyl cis-trans isomerase A (cyclophilin A)
MKRLASLLVLLSFCVPAYAEDPKPAGSPPPAAEPAKPPVAEPAKPATSPSTDATAMKYAKLSTNLGDLIFELDPKAAPKTVENFLRYVAEGYYKGTVVHRVQRDAKNGHLVAMGAADENFDKKTTGLHEPIDSEWKEGMKNARGTIGMVRTPYQFKKCTQAEFFINTADNRPGEDINRDGGGQVVFGKVVRGLDTLDRITASELTEHKKYPVGKVVPAVPVVVTDCKIVEYKDLDREFKPYSGTPKAEGEKQPAKPDDAKTP